MNMAALVIPLAEELAETAHWSDDPPVRIEEQEFDLMAFELWHLGSLSDLSELEEWEDEECTVAGRASCL
jgi:hypothetical protein